MKKIVFICLLFCSVFLHGQTSVYFPFPDSNAVWCDSSGFYHSPTMGCSVNNFYMSGDTVISGKNYHKIMQKSQGHYVTASHYCIASPLPPFYEAYAGAMRQDTALRKIYFIRRSETADSLLYDFNVNVGDTLRNYILQLAPGFPMVVTAIDSVLIGVKYRKRLIVSEAGCVLNGEIIEGIGSTMGLLWMDNTGDGGEPIGKLYCFSQNNQTLYPFYDPSSGCALTLAVADLSQAEKFSISPNPGSGIFLVEPETEDKRELTVFDVNGKFLLKMKISGKTKLDISDYDNGVYILSLRAEDKITYKKLIKN